MGASKQILHMLSSSPVLLPGCGAEMEVGRGAETTIEGSEEAEESWDGCERGDGYCLTGTGMGAGAGGVE